MILSEAEVADKRVLPRLSQTLAPLRPWPVLLALALQHGLRWLEASQAVKDLPASAEDGTDAGLIPGSGRSPGAGGGNPPQSSCLENLMDRGTWQATVHGAAKSWTRLKHGRQDEWRSSVTL